MCNNAMATTQLACFLDKLCSMQPHGVHLSCRPHMMHTVLSWTVLKTPSQVMRSSQHHLWYVLWSVHTSSFASFGLKQSFHAMQWIVQLSSMVCSFEGQHL